MAVPCSVVDAPLDTSYNKNCERINRWRQKSEVHDGQDRLAKGNSGQSGE